METMTCPKCSARILKPEIKPVLINHPEKCIIVLDAPRISCPNPLCAGQFTYIISEFRFALRLVPAPPIAPKKDIIVPNLVLPKNLKG